MTHQHQKSLLIVAAFKKEMFSKYPTTHYLMALSRSQNIPYTFSFQMAISNYFAISSMAESIIVFCMVTL